MTNEQLGRLTRSLVSPVMAGNVFCYPATKRDWIIIALLDVALFAGIVLWRYV